MITILVADDNPQVQRLVRKVLAATEFRVLEAANSGQALSIVGDGMPDIILLDFRLGEEEMTGIELARRIRGLPGGASAILVAFSAGAVLEDEKMIREAGFDDFIPKPFDVVGFAERIKGYLEKKGKSNR